MFIELSCLCEFPIVVGNFEDAFQAWKVCDFGVHQSCIGVNVMGVVGWVPKRKVWRIGQKCPKGSIARGIRTMLRSRRSPMTVSPLVVVPVVELVLLLRPIFFFLYFCRCELALAVNIVVTSGEVGSKEGHGGGPAMVRSKPMVV